VGHPHVQVVGSALVDVTESSSSGKVEIVLGTEEHATLTQAFFREVWPSDTEAPTRREPSTGGVVSERAPVRSPSSLAILDDRVIGYLGTIPLRFWNGHVEQSGYWFKGFMVLPEFRNGPIGYALVKELSRHVPIAFVITVQPASWRLFKAIGLTHLGALENRLRLLRPARVFRKIDFDRLGMTGTSRRISTAVKLAQRIGVAGVGGMFVGAALGAWSMLRGSKGRGIRTAVVGRIDPAEYDDLWSRCSQGFQFAQVRDGEYVQRRFLSDDAYILIEARDGATLVGFGAVRRPRSGGDERLAGLVIAPLSDVLTPLDRCDVSLAILACAERTARSLGADALTCSASHPFLLSALSARAYLRIPPTLQFLARVGKGESVGSISDWWLLRADGNADEGF
jgi:hypothetical protein